MQSFALGLRAAFFVLFLVAAGSKMRSSAARQGFVRWVGDLAVVPQSAAGTVAQLTIALETVIAVLLLTPWAPVAFALAALVLAGFAVATAVVVRRGTQARCLCFGASPAVLGRRHVVRDGALAAVAAAGIGLGGAALPPAAGIAVAGAAGCSLALAVVLLDEFLELFSL
ncbi:MAG: hypothetical protein JF587_15795 [Catenulisporales bacterium]|nr:hypothetical protein [Catenulisporales bacterium]